MIFLALLLFAGLGFWAGYDAKCRGDRHYLAWGVAIFLQPLVVGILYLIVRPQGRLIDCLNCKKPMLETLEKCPHCGIRKGGVEGETVQ